MTPPTIKGHPHLVSVTDTDERRITVCAECEALSSILFLSGDRWYCTRCRNAGDARPTQVPITRPRSKR